MPKKCNTCVVVASQPAIENIEVCKKEEYLITPNQYCDFFDVEEVPANFKELLEIAILNLNRILLYKSINQDLKEKHPLWNSNIRKAILFQMKYQNQNRELFGMDLLSEPAEELREVKIGDFSYKAETVNVINKNATKRHLIVPASLTYLRNAGLTSRVIC